jgi:HlyD family secretion protein
MDKTSDAPSDEPVAVHPLAGNSSLPPQSAAVTSASKAAGVFVALFMASMIGLSVWYVTRPQPLLVQGEADATRIDIAARVDGRIAERPVSRGDNVVAGQVLFRIENPQLLTKLLEAEAARAVSLADLARIQAGTRTETIASRKAALIAGEASVKLAQQTYDRVKQLADRDFASNQRLDEATASLDVAITNAEQARLSYQAAVAGATAEELAVARSSVARADANIATLKAQVEELVIKAPSAAQVYQIGTEPGEFVSPGVPLLTLINLGDVWLKFNLREDLVKGLNVGDRLNVNIPALGSGVVAVTVRTIATRGEYAGWRATRATGDFDLRTFEVRAYPVEPLPGLRPGMSVYFDRSGIR